MNTKPKILAEAFTRLTTEVGSGQLDASEAVRQLEQSVEANCHLAGAVDMRQVIARSKPVSCVLFPTIAEYLVTDEKHDPTEKGGFPEKDVRSEIMSIVLLDMATFEPDTTQAKGASQMLELVHSPFPTPKCIFLDPWSTWHEIRLSDDDPQS